MSKQMMCALAVCGAMMTANEARAEVRAGMYGNLMQTWYRASVTGFPTGIPSAYDNRYQPGECAKATAAEKKAGAKPSDTLVGDYKDHPKAKPAGDQFSIVFAEAPAICTAYEAQLKIALGMDAIKKSAAYMKGKSSAPTAAEAKGYNSGAGDSTVAMGKNCLATIAAMIKAGSAPSTKLKVESGEVTLEELTKTCQAVVDHGTAFNALIAEEQKAKRGDIAKKYEAAGIKGDKLALLIEYDDVYWRNTKCEKTDDVAELAKAKVLIHWLENSDGTQTIRRYTFNGSKVSKTEKTYNTEAAAQRGCR
ncbi:MAG: hypothetical protein ABI867_34285 [Kofleriaceae bacterium]